MKHAKSISLDDRAHPSSDHAIIEASIVGFEAFSNVQDP